MLLLSKSRSRTVHHHHDERETGSTGGGGGGGDGGEASTSLTVWRKSLVFNCSGFTVIGSDGGLAYRVDNYSGRPNQILLMDGSGHPIFTLSRRKKLRLLDYWLVYEGDVGKYNMKSSSSSSKKPMFCVRKHLNIRQTKVDHVLAHVYSGMSEQRRCMYVVEGSFSHRSCKVLDDSRRTVAEIKKKEAVLEGAPFGLEVFHLVVRPEFCCRFAMAIVLLLDQMY